MQRLSDALNEPPFRVATVPFVNGVVYGVAISPDGSTLYPYGEHFGDGIGRLFSPAGAEIGRIRAIVASTEFESDLFYWTDGAARPTR